MQTQEPGYLFAVFDLISSRWGELSIDDMSDHVQKYVNFKDYCTSWGDVMYVMLISDMQYSAAEVDFVHAMYKAESDDKCITASPLGYMQIHEPHDG